MQDIDADHRIPHVDKKCKKSVHWYSTSLMGLIYKEAYTATETEAMAWIQF